MNPVIIESKMQKKNFSDDACIQWISLIFVSPSHSFCKTL